jgi:hypothetical protein
MQVAQQQLQQLAQTVLQQQVESCKQSLQAAVLKKLLLQQDLQMRHSSRQEKHRMQQLQVLRFSLCRTMQPHSSSSSSSRTQAQLSKRSTQLGTILQEHHSSSSSRSSQYRRLLVLTLRERST